jgi:hypothetical protein
MNEIEKYTGFKAELALAETFESIKDIESRAAAAAEFARKQKIGLDEQNEWGKFRVQIEAKKGEWLDKFFPHGKQKEDENNLKVPGCNLYTEHVTKRESVQARTVSRNPEIAKEVMKSIEEKNKVITPSLVAAKIKETISEPKKEAEKTFTVVVPADKIEHGENSSGLQMKEIPGHTDGIIYTFEEGKLPFYITRNGEWDVKNRMKLKPGQQFKITLI